MQEYFFLAVSNRENLQLCKKHVLAGFPDTVNGVWAYSDIKVGDYVTFLYGARAHNLYRVVEKEAILEARDLPPWKPLHFKQSGKICYFPFRLHLELLREFEEPLARCEFMYIAENLLQRGGYWKTHFQADQTTLQNVSQMGRRSEGRGEPLEMPPCSTFTPRFLRAGRADRGVYPLREVILQSVIRQYLLRRENLEGFLCGLGLEELPSEEFEVLGEKALPEGYVDILLKEARPRGEVRQIAVEVKLGRAGRGDVEQLRGYVEEMGRECLAGVLIADHPPVRARMEDGRIHLMKYELGVDLKSPRTLKELVSSLVISEV